VTGSAIEKTCRKKPEKVVKNYGNSKSLINNAPGLFFSGFVLFPLKPQSRIEDRK